MVKNNGGFRVMETLAQMMNLAITEEYVLSEWRKSFVVPLYKSGDSLKWLAIIEELLLGSCVAKVF